jgi:hypothetical protein
VANGPDALHDGSMGTVLHEESVQPGNAINNAPHTAPCIMPLAAAEAVPQPATR